MRTEYLPNSKTVVVYTDQDECEYNIYFDRLTADQKLYLDLAAQERIHENLHTQMLTAEVLDEATGKITRQRVPHRRSVTWPGFGDNDEAYGYVIEDRTVFGNVHTLFGGDLICFD